MTLSRLIRFFIAALLSTVAAAQAATVGDVSHIKGQEGDTLTGFGLVVGLSGTGDGSTPTLRAYAKFLEQLGTPLTRGDKRQVLLDEIKSTPNVAMVFVTVELPAAGAREGDKLTCRVSAPSAKSLEGGELLNTVLHGPNPNAYAMASGRIQIDDPNSLARGKVDAGVRVIRDVKNQFVFSGKMTLVLDSNHASFAMAQEIEHAINADAEFVSRQIARAIDPKNIDVTVPEAYLEAPVQFANAIKSIALTSLPRDNRVIINKSTGVIVIGANVEIMPVAISHKNLTIEVGGDDPAPTNAFRELNPQAEQSTPSLPALVSSLNTLQVSTKDMIEIIKAIDRKGALFGTLIIE